MSTPQELITAIATDIGTLKGNSIDKTASKFKGSISENAVIRDGANLVLDASSGTILLSYTNGNTTLTITDALEDGEFVTVVIDSGSSLTVTYPYTQWWENKAPTLASTDKLFFEKIAGQLYGTHAGSIGESL